MRSPGRTPIVPRQTMTARATVAMLTLLLAGLVLSGCGGPSEAGEPIPSPGAVPSTSAAGSTSPAFGSPSPETPGPAASAAAGGAPAGGVTPELCEGFETVRMRLGTLAALELRPTAKVTLDIELSRVQVAFSDLRDEIQAARDLDVDEPLRLLGYRLDDLALAVEDFKTTPRPRVAANHVAEETVVFGDALAGFELLVGC
jgi:hypothetical protein